jgi:hypothetical protein
VKVKISADVREQIDRESYERLIGELIYLYHICFIISFIISVVNCYMHDFRTDHMTQESAKC